MSNSCKNDARSPYPWDTLILSLVACIILLQSLIAAKMRYDGVGSPEDFGKWLVFVGFPMFALTAVGATGVMTTLVLRILKRSSCDGKMALLLRYVGAVLIIICYVSTLSGPSRDVTFLRGLRDWILDNADLTAISDWLPGVEHVSSDGNALPRSEWPPVIADLSPRFVYVARTSQNIHVVHLIWGGGFGHFGLSVTEGDKPLPYPSRKGPYLTIGSRASVWLEKQN